MVHHVVPATVMLLAYIRISVQLKQRAARVRPVLQAVDPAAAASTVDTAQPINPAESLLRARRNTIKTLLFVFATFLICWTPNQMIFLMLNLGFLALRFDEWYYLLVLAMVPANCCVNPFIYPFNYWQFRKGLRKLFRH